MVRPASSAGARSRTSRATDHRHQETGPSAGGQASRADSRSGVSRDRQPPPCHRPGCDHRATSQVWSMIVDSGATWAVTIGTGCRCPRAARANNHGYVRRCRPCAPCSRHGVPPCSCAASAASSATSLDRVAAAPSAGCSLSRIIDRLRAADDLDFHARRDRSCRQRGGIDDQVVHQDRVRLHAGDDHSEILRPASRTHDLRLPVDLRNRISIGPDSSPRSYNAPRAVIARSAGSLKVVVRPASAP